MDNGTGSSFSGSGATYRLRLTPDADFQGDLTVRVPAGVTVDSASNLNEAGSESFAVDTLAPTLVTSGGATVNGPTLTLEFAETRASMVSAALTGVDDDIDDDAETVVITAAVGGAGLGQRRTVTIEDDDDPELAVRREPDRPDGARECGQRQRGGPGRKRVAEIWNAARPGVGRQARCSDGRHP